MIEVPAHNQFAELLQSVSLSPPRNPSQLPGLNFWSSFGKSSLLFLLPFIFMFGMLPIMMFSTDKDLRAQLRTMSTAQGQITSIQRIQTPYPQITLHYSFAISANAVYYGSSIVRPDSPFAQLKQGVPLPIMYDPDDPAFNGIAGVLGKNTPLFVVFIFPLMAALFFGPFLLLPLKQVIRARQIFKQGVLTTGRIHFVKRNRNFSLFHVSNPATPTFEVVYTFNNEAGQPVQGRQVCDNDWLLNKLDIGSEINVIYLSRQPNKSIFLEPFIA